jgi:hypothetical protein
MTRTALVLILLVGASVPALADETPRIDQAQARQRERISAGIQSGQLTAPEARRLTQQERQLNRHELRVKADGTVTPAERYRLNRDAERTSRNIYRQKHDRQHRQ